MVLGIWRNFFNNLHFYFCFDYRILPKKIRNLRGNKNIARKYLLLHQPSCMIMIRCARTSCGSTKGYTKYIITFCWSYHEYHTPISLPVPHYYSAFFRQTLLPRQPQLCFSLGRYAAAAVAVAVFLFPISQFYFSSVWSPKDIRSKDQGVSWHAVPAKNSSGTQDTAVTLPSFYPLFLGLANSPLDPARFVMTVLLTVVVPLLCRLRSSAALYSAREITWHRWEQPVYVVVVAAHGV